jgi:phytoene dehydrogenase-like protein
MEPVVVVGAGLAGLTAAAKLVRARIPVVVLESAASPGGRARTSERDGYLLNLGPHALATRGPGTAVLRELGIDLPGRPPTIVGARYLCDGQVVTAIGRRRGGPGLRLGPAMARFVRAARGAPPGRTVEEVIEGATDDAATRAVLRATARLMTYSDGLDRQSARVIAEVSTGGWVRYLDGGWGGLVARLRSAVEAAGGEIRTAAPVHAVEADADRDTSWQGSHVDIGSAWAIAGPVGRRGQGSGPVGPRVHLADGEVLPTSAVIVAAGGPTQVAGLLEGAARRHLDAWAEAAAPVRMASLDVALRRRPPMPSIVLGAERPLYLSVHSDRSRIAPPGGAVVQVARYLGVDDGAPRNAREELESLLDLVAEGWRDDVVHARFLPDLVVTHDAVLAGRGGSPVPDGGGGVRGRPGPEVPEAPGLFVAGDWVGPRGYLAQASLASAGAAAEMAAAYARRRVAAGAATVEADV